MREKAEVLAKNIKIAAEAEDFDEIDAFCAHWLKITFKDYGTAGRHATTLLDVALNLTVNG